MDIEKFENKRQPNVFLLKWYLVRHRWRFYHDRRSLVVVCVVDELFVDN